MSRTPKLTSPKRTNIIIEAAVHEAAKDKMHAMRIGSFSEYIARLIVRDQARKGSAAEKTSRHLRKARK